MPKVESEKANCLLQPCWRMLPQGKTKLVHALTPKSSNSLMFFFFFLGGGLLFLVRNWYYWSLTRWVPDISVIKMIISVAIWRIYLSWVNDKFRAWEGLGHSGMFWARLSRDDFRSKLENISFLSRVCSSRRVFFFVPPRFCKIWYRIYIRALLVSTTSWRSSWNSARSVGIFFANSHYDLEYFWKFPFFFQAEQSIWWWYVEN